MYSFNIFNCNDKIFYEIVSKKGSIFNLIKDIDNNDISFIEQYKQVKYKTENSRVLIGWSWLQMITTLGLMFYLFSKLIYFSHPLTIMFIVFIILTVSSYTFLLDGKKYTIFFEGLKFIVGIGLFRYMSDHLQIIPELTVNYIYIYLFISLGLTFYFYKYEIQKLTKSPVIQQ